MSVFFILLQRDLKTWLFSSVFYAHCVLFSFFSLAAMFLISDFMSLNEADLSHVFFRWLPWIFAITTPVIGIRSWSEESQCGVFEVFGTLPIKMSQLVLAKACSGFIVVLLTLFFTLPAVITVFWLGEPDHGVILSSYLGSLLCGFAFTCLSQAISVFMRVSIGSFVCSAALCLLLLAAGINQVANMILASFPSSSWVVSLLSGLSVIAKYEPFYQGRIDFSAIAGFLLLIIISLLMSHRALLRQRGNKQPKYFNRKSFTYGIPFPFIIMGYFILSLSLSFLPGYIDVTKSQRFQLPAKVSDELSQLSNQVTVRVFATDNHPNFTYNLLRYKQRIIQMLTLVADKSAGNINIEVLNPNLDPRAARIAAIDEIHSRVFDDGKPFIFGLVVESLDRKRVFHNIAPKREQYFLADLVQAVVDLGQAQPKKIALVSPFNSERSDPMSLDNWTGIMALNDSYNINQVAITDDWSSADIVMVFHPTQNNALLSGKLASFVLSGGDVMVFADPLSFMSETFANDGVISLRSSGLPEFVTRRGIDLPNGLEIYDFLLQTEHETDKGIERDPTILTLGAEQFNSQHSISAGFDFIHFVHSGMLNITPVSGYKTTTLIKSSQQALLLDTNIALQGASSQVEQAMGQLQELNQGYPLAVIQESNNDPSAGRLLVVADTDWLYGAIAGTARNDGNNTTFNANIALLRNMVDFLAGNRSISELRTRSLSKRPLQRWQEIKQTISKPYQILIAKLAIEQSQLENKLNKIEQSRRISARQVNVSHQIESVVKKLRSELKIRKVELLAIRSQKEAEIKRYLTLLKWSNVLGAPFIALLLGIAVTRLRARSIKGRINA